MTIFATTATLLFLALFILGCGSSIDVASGWSASTLPVDSAGASAWTSSLVPVKDTNVRFGAKNDQDYLYLCLESTDPQFRRQLPGAGLTIWFEPKGGDKIGIHYPIGFAGRGMPLETRAATGESPEAPQEGATAEGEPTPERRDNASLDVVKEVEILGPGKDETNRYPLLEAPGIEAWLGQAAGQTVYELKVPLKKTATHPYAIVAAPGTIVKIDMETAKMERPSRPANSGMRGGGGEGGRSPGGEPGGWGGRGGMRGGRGGHGGGYRGASGESGNRPQQFELKADVKLAAGPTLSSANIQVEKAQ